MLLTFTYASPVTNKLSTIHIKRPINVQRLVITELIH